MSYLHSLTVPAPITVSPHISAKPKIVIFSRTPESVRQTAEAVVLQALVDGRVGRSSPCPSVSLSLLDKERITDSRIDEKAKGKLGNKVIHLDTGNNQRTIHEALYDYQAMYLPSKDLLKRKSLYMDEGYLHSTLSSWDGKTMVDKALVIAAAMFSKRSIAFTLHFSKERRKSLSTDPAKLLRYLRNQLQKVTDLGPTVIAVERCKDGKLHLHGIVQTNEPRAVVKDSLWGLAGKSSNVAFRNLIQLKVEQTKNALGWVMYLTKDALKLPADEMKGQIYISQDATQLGREFLPELKRLADSKLGCKSDWRGKASVYAKKSSSAVSARASGVKLVRRSRACRRRFSVGFVVGSLCS